MPSDKRHCWFSPVISLIHPGSFRRSRLWFLHAVSLATHSFPRSISYHFVDVKRVGRILFELYRSIPRLFRWASQQSLTSLPQGLPYLCVPSPFESFLGLTEYLEPITLLDSVKFCPAAFVVVIVQVCAWPIDAANGILCCK